MRLQSKCSKITLVFLWLTLPELILQDLANNTNIGSLIQYKKNSKGGIPLYTEGKLDLNNITLSMRITNDIHELCSHVMMKILHE